MFQFQFELNELARRANKRVFFRRDDDFLKQSPPKSPIRPEKLWKQLRFTEKFEAKYFLEIIRLVQVEQRLRLHCTCLLDQQWVT